MTAANITNVLQNTTKISNLRIVNHHGYTDYKTTNKAIDMLMEEGGESFYNYVVWLGLIKEPDLVVLSSKHHYYYDPEEMHDTKTIINIKELNQIKQIKPFLHSCLNFLPEKSNFIGCFIDNEKINGYEIRNLSNSYSDNGTGDDIQNGIASRFSFINLLYSIIDSKTTRYMSKKSITLLLKEFDFKIMDMTECRGFTFFHAQKFHDYN
jgi:hypothetical protein